MKTVIDVIGREVTITDNMYFVTMTDRFLSGWGRAEGKTAKRVVICNSYRQAQIIADGIRNCRNQNGMRYVNICSELPRYGARYVVSYDRYEDCTLYREKSDIKE